ARHRPDHLVALHVPGCIEHQPVAASPQRLHCGDRLRGIGFAEKRKREVDLLGWRRLPLQPPAPFVQGHGGLPGRPDSEEKPHSFGKCFRVKAARAFSSESGDLSSCAAISSISRLLRFCESFQRVSMRVTVISKLTMPSSIIVTYFSESFSNSGSHCGSMA